MKGTHDKSDGKRSYCCFYEITIKSEIFENIFFLSEFQDKNELLKLLYTSLFSKILHILLF